MSKRKEKARRRSLYKNDGGKIWNPNHQGRLERGWSDRGHWSGPVMGSSRPNHSIQHRLRPSNSWLLESSVARSDWFLGGLIPTQELDRSILEPDYWTDQSCSYVGQCTHGITQAFLWIDSDQFKRSTRSPHLCSNFDPNKSQWYQHVYKLRIDPQLLLNSHLNISLEHHVLIYQKGKKVRTFDMQSLATDEYRIEREILTFEAFICSGRCRWRGVKRELWASRTHDETGLNKKTLQVRVAQRGRQGSREREAMEGESSKRVRVTEIRAHVVKEGATEHDPYLRESRN